MVKLYDEFISEQKNEYSSCLMINFNIPSWRFNSHLIDKNDIYNTEDNSYGIENKEHVTVLYGINNNIDIDEIKRYLIPLDQIIIEFKNVSYFSNKDFDVLKYDVYSDELFKLNKILTENIDYKNDYPEYHPYATIAYLKPGTAEKYIKKFENLYFNEQIFADKYSYSTYTETEKKKIFFKI